MSNSEYARQKLTAVRDRIKRACDQSDRAPDAVKLLGASKKQSIELVSRFVKQGLADLGENYLQEAIDKQCHKPSLNVDWHFIGQIQSNKTKAIAKHFNWVHGISPRGFLSMLRSSMRNWTMSVRLKRRSTYLFS